MSDSLHACLSTSNDRQSRTYLRAPAPLLNGGDLPRDTKDEKTIMTTFADFGFDTPILNAISAEGYETPTPIQLQAIPPAMQSLDILGLAQTGTGKTAAFALPLLHHLSTSRSHPGAKGCRALILVPTRELAGQIADAIRTYGKFAGLSSALVYGGANMRKQINSMERGVDILIATPGRLIDLMKQRAIRLDRVEHLILDEADQMLDMGFIKPIRLVVGEIPKTRQTSLFSATMPKEISHLAEELLTDPKRIQIAALSSPAERVDQKLIMVGQVNKQLVLENICNKPDVTRAMIFVRTKHGAEKVLDKLEAQGMSADAVHGNKSQNAREQALEKFRKGQTRLLVCTDVAARGIDVDGVTHVFNFDLPDVPEAYIHRIGRTARAGTEGVSISFCAPHERDNLRQIERLIKKSISKIDNEMARAPVHSKPAPVAVSQPMLDEDGEEIFVENMDAPATLTLVANAHGDVVGQVRRKGPREMLHEPRNDPRKDGKFGSRGNDRAERNGPRGGSYSRNGGDAERRPRPSGFATQSVFNEGRPQQRDESRFAGGREERAPRPSYQRPQSDAPRGQDERPRFDQKFHGDYTPQAQHGRDARPSGDRPSYNRGGDDRPRNDRPQGERPYSDRPQADRSSYGDRPSYNNAPRGDRPQSAGYQGDRPRSYEGRSEGFGHRNGQQTRDSATRHGQAPRGQARIEGAGKSFGNKSFGDKPARGPAGGGKPVSQGRSGARGGANVGRGGGENTFTGRRDR
jgi:ATP-dependent RNA helicase RhlE